MSENESSFGDLLSLFRRKKKISTNQISSILSMSMADYSNIEHNEGKPLNDDQINILLVEGIIDETEAFVLKNARKMKKSGFGGGVALTETEKERYISKHMQDFIEKIEDLHGGETPFFLGDTQAIIEYGMSCFNQGMIAQAATYGCIESYAKQRAYEWKYLLDKPPIDKHLQETWSKISEAAPGSIYCSVQLLEKIYWRI